MSMPVFTMLHGLLLILLGAGGYLLTGGTSLTALIPAAFGVVMGLLGWFGRRESLRRHLMHAAAVLALIGLVPTLKGIGGALTLLGGGTVERPEAAVVQALMAVLCTVYLLVAVRSFIAARRKRSS
jgi:hypothetical protein